MQGESSQSAANPGIAQRHSSATVRWQDVDTRVAHRSKARPHSLFAITEHYGPGKLITPRPSPTSDNSTSTPSSTDSDELLSGSDLGSLYTEEDTDETEEGVSTTSLPMDKESWGWGLYLRLENAGIVARDHLALERTFLAYVRTSLALTSAGVALAQVMSIPTISDDDALWGHGHHSPHYDHPKAIFGRRLGATAICLGLAMLFIGLMRFFSVQWMLVHGRFPLSRHNVVGITSVFSMMLVAVLSYIIIHH